MILLLRQRQTSDRGAPHPSWIRIQVVAFDLPAVARKKESVGFDGGRMSSDAGVLLLRGVERQLGLARRLAECVTDRRDPLADHPPSGGDDAAADVRDRGGF